MRKKTREGKEGDRFKILLKKEEKTRTTKRRANSLGNSKPALSGEFQTGGDKILDFAQKMGKKSRPTRFLRARCTYPSHEPCEFANIAGSACP